MYQILSDIKSALEVLDVKTCRVGIENALSPDDYPIIRIVPQLAEFGPAICDTKMTVLIYFGLPISEADDGLEAVYESLCDLADQIALAMTTSEAFTGDWIETIFDDDRIEHYKLGASRFTAVART